MIASESNGYRPGRACVAAHRTGIWACQGHDPLFLWLRWVEVSPKRFSLHARYSFYPSKYAASPQVAKVCVPLFLFSRRKEGHVGIGGHSGHLGGLSQGIRRGSRLRQSPPPGAACTQPRAKLSHSSRTELKPRPMCGRRSRFSTLGSILGYRGQYFASGTPGMHQTDGNPAEVRNFLVFCSVCISPVAHGHHDVHAGEFCCV